MSAAPPGFELEDFGSDLTALARAGRLDPVAGREAVIERVVLVLGRRTKRNPVLLGEPGVGKSAVAEGLAQRIAAGSVPPALQGRLLFSLDLGRLIAGTSYRGEFEGRLRDLVAALRAPGPARILFIDELHLLARAGRSEGGLDAASLLKPLLARGELPCIGASTPGEWAELSARDPAIARRFQPVGVPEPGPEAAFVMLQALRPRLESHHDVALPDEVLWAAVALSAGAAPGRHLPDRAIDLLDEACSRVSLARALGPAVPPVSLRRALEEAERRFDLDGVARLRRALASQASPVGARPCVTEADLLPAG
jgi:ATP-dependent Clp protease ATP-binding subunit ClpB